MANRINFQLLVRKIHFLSSIVVFVFALLYIFSGLVISKGNWFDHPPEKRTTTVFALDFNPDTTQMKQLGSDLKKQLGITGRMTYAKNWKKEWEFTYYRPMVRNVVTLYPALDSIKVVHAENITFHEANKRIHRVHGYHGGITYVIWAIMLDILAVSMIIFAFTGFIIWYKFRKQMFYGWLIVVPAIILLIVILFYLK